MYQVVNIQGIPEPPGFRIVVKERIRQCLA